MFSVMKKSHTKRRSRPHFEQVPLEVVKKIADREASKTEKAGNVVFEPASGKTDPIVPADSVGSDMKSLSAARPR
jgi:hypothetical protein